MTPRTCERCGEELIKPRPGAKFCDAACYARTDAETLLELYDRGLSLGQIARRMKVTRQAIHQRLRTLTREKTTEG